jgi:hypothetical protein
MFGRIFGRDKDDTEQAVCAECGRTLLAGEWTRKVTGPNGEVQLICSLCGPDHPLDEDEPMVVTATPANNGRVRETREDAPVPPAASGPSAELEAKNAEIAALRERLVRADARNSELARKVALLSVAIASEAVASEEPEDVAAAPVAEEPEAAPTAEEPEDVVAASVAEEPEDDVVAAPVASEPEDVPTADAVEADAVVPVEEQTLDSSEPGERTWGETPAEFAAEFAAAMPVVAEAEEGTSAGTAGETAAPAFEDTQPLPVVGGEAQEVGGEDVLPEEAGAADEIDREPAEEPAPEPTADDVAALALLQCGVDLFNVSRVPHKIAETNEQLGIPSVNVSPEDEFAVFTFMWSMGWYSFHVDTASGEARMADRGYEEITDLVANAGVRADGTVHLAPAQISRAAAQRVQADDQPGSCGGEQRSSEPETPSVVAQKPPEILSKSLLGQRSDGEPAAWEQAKARDFDWKR